MFDPKIFGGNYSIVTVVLVATVASYSIPVFNSALVPHGSGTYVQRLSRHPHRVSPSFKSFQSFQSL